MYTYAFKGPMGLGLDIQPTGVHIAYSAGTGILPFLDLVAYLVRLNLDTSYQKDKLESSWGKDQDGIFDSTRGSGRGLIDQRQTRKKKYIELENFKLVLYASHETESMSIGRELC